MCYESGKFSRAKIIARWRCEIAIQYSGGPVLFTNFLGDNIADLKNGINTNLTNAGWSTAIVAGGYTVTSALSPQGLQCSIKLLDNGTSVTIQFCNTALTQLGAIHTTTPAANKRYQIIADPFQFFLFLPNVSTQSSGAIMGGVPWVPAFLQAGTTTAIWSIGDGGSSTFRNSLAPNPSDSDYQFNAFVGSGSGQGSPQLFGVQSNATALGLAGLWFNNAAIICEPMLGYGTSNNAIPVIVGELWDAALVMQAYQLDLQTNFNGHNYTNITDNFAGGSLFVATS